MRLNSTTFTHFSTAIFGLAVVGYAAVRLVSHGVPHLPGHEAAPAPHVQQHEASREGGQRASRSTHRSPAPTRKKAPVRRTDPVTEHRIKDREKAAEEMPSPYPTVTPTTTRYPLEASPPEDTASTEPADDDDDDAVDTSATATPTATSSSDTD